MFGFEKSLSSAMTLQSDLQGASELRGPRQPLLPIGQSESLESSQLSKGLVTHASQVTLQIRRRRVGY